MIDPVITFDKNSIIEILYCFDKNIDDEGYVIDGNNHRRILAIDGKEIKVDEIAGIIKEGFVRNNIISLIELNDIIENR